ncbi:peptidoglycan-binding domain-containing protein [Brachybacterium huguangmaarense]
MVTSITRRALSVVAGTAATIALGAAFAAPATAAPVAEAAPATVSAKASSCSKPSTVQKVRKGDHGASVVYVQCLLRNNGYSYVVVDGSFGSNTDRAVRDWQAKHPSVGAVDGVVGPKTLKSLEVWG